MKYVFISDDTATVAVDGRYDLVRNVEVTKEIQEALGQGCRRIHIDLSKTTYIDSSVEWSWIRLHRKVGEANFRLSGATGMVLDALRTAKFDKWIR